MNRVIGVGVRSQTGRSTPTDQRNGQIVVDTFQHTTASAQLLNTFLSFFRQFGQQRRFRWIIVLQQHNEIGLANVHATNGSN